MNLAKELAFALLTGHDILSRLPSARDRRSFQPLLHRAALGCFWCVGRDLNYAFDLVLATDDWIQLALLRQLGQIAAKGAQGGRLYIFLIALLRGLSLAFRRCEVRVQFF